VLNEMTTEEKERSWCAVHTRYQHEGLVDTLLTQKGFETFLPTYKKVHRWKDRKKEITHALFPGYLFVADAQAERLRIVTTPGVSAMVSIAGVPVTIPDAEVANIRRAVLDPFAVEPHPLIQDGDFVRIVGGPFEGMEGILVRKSGSTRLVVSIELLGRAAAVEMNEAFVLRIDAKRASLASHAAGDVR